MIAGSGLLSTLASPAGAQAVVLLLLKLSLVLLFAWLLDAVLQKKNPRWRVLLWRASTLSLLALPILSITAPKFTIPIQLFSDERGEEPASPSKEDRSDNIGDRFAKSAESSDSVALPAVQSKTEDGAGLSSPKSTDSALVSPLAPSPLAATHTQPPPPASHFSSDELAAASLLTLWFLGVAVLTIHLLLGHRFASRLKASSIGVDATIEQIFQAVAADLQCRRIPKLRTSAILSTPLLVGIRNPLLILPKSTGNAPNIAELRAIFAHELSHLRTHDMIWGYALHVVSILLWFHPLLWKVHAAHAEACEEACDATAARYCGDVRHYAMTLVRIAERQHVAAVIRSGMAMARRSEISRRLNALRRSVLPLPLTRTQDAAFVAAAAFFIIGLGSVGLAEFQRAPVSFRAVGADAGPDSWVGDLTPIAKADWSYARAGHLLERAGFGGTPEEIARLAHMTPQAAVDDLVEYASKNNSYLPAFDESGIYDPGVIPYADENVVISAMDEARAKGSALGIKVSAGGPMPFQGVVDEGYYHMYASRLESRRVSLWWANRMLQTNRPLEEKIALFWHSHFALSYDKVGDYRKVLIYLQTLRKNGTGNFRDFVLAIAQDPGMLVYLDNGLNVKGHANENFAREILELFTMGEGQGYTEKDIREAARAFTGWTHDDTKFAVKEEMHDTENKTILGETGHFDGENVVDLIMKQEVTARRLTQKIYRYFVAESIPAGVNEAMAKRLRDEKYELKPLLKKMFLSKDFYSSNAFATQIKTPAHLVVSTCKRLGLREIPGVPDFRAAMVAMGQELLAPPNAAGWEGGRSWINPATLLERGNYVENIFYGQPEERTGPLRPSGGGELDRPRSRWQPIAPPPANSLVQRKEEVPSAVETSAPPTTNTNPNYRYLTTREFNINLGVIHGVTKANERVKEIPQAKAQVRLASMARWAGARTPEEIVDYFTLRFLRLPLGDDGRTALIDFVSRGLGEGPVDYEADDTEDVLRELAHLIMSAPEFQLS